MLEVANVRPLKYSVIVCCYNKISSLPLVVDGLKSANRDLELILVDDGSTDGSVEWARGSGVFSHIHSEEPPGKFRINSLRNKGLELSSCEFVVILDADCVPEETHFIGHDFIFGFSDNLMSVGRRKFYTANGNSKISDDDRCKLFGEDDLWIMPWCAVYGFNIAFRKEACVQLGGFDTNFDGEWGFDDLDFTYRAEKSGVVFASHKFSTVRHLEHKSSYVDPKNSSNLKLLEKKHGNIIPKSL